MSVFVDFRLHHIYNTIITYFFAYREKNMKNFRIIPVFLLICLLFGLFGGTMLAEGIPEPPALGAKAAFVGDLSTGKSVFTLYPDARRAPASLTKIMTALLTVEAIESGRVSLDDMVTAPGEAFSDLAEDGSSVGLMPGEIMSLKDLLYCALLSSANDACNVIAVHVGGSIENFVAMMNDRAADLGCENTHFVNAHGLPNDEHYSSAADLFTIFSEDLEHELFVTVASTAVYRTSSTNVSEPRSLKNTNALINSQSVYGKTYYYEPTICGKTGHTEAAGYCLISAAEKDGVRLCTVVLGCDKEPTRDSEIFHHFTESAALYDWVFDNFAYTTLLTANAPVSEVAVTMGEEKTLVLNAGSDITVLLPNDIDASKLETRLDISDDPIPAPVTAGQIVGKVSIIGEDGTVLGSAKLIAASAIKLSGGELILKKLGEFLGHTWVLLLLTLLLIIVAVYIILAINYRKKRKAQLRRKAESAGKH